MPERGERMGYQMALTAVALTVCAYTDLRCKKVYKKVVLSYLFLAAAGRILQGPEALLQAAEGALPGIFCVVLSFVTRQGLGYGDSILILVCGVSLGLELCICLTLSAFFWAGIWAMVLFCRKRAEHGRTFAFVPFLLLGFVIQGVMWLV